MTILSFFLQARSHPEEVSQNRNTVESCYGGFICHLMSKQAVIISVRPLTFKQRGALEKPSRPA